MKVFYIDEGVDGILLERVQSDEYKQKPWRTRTPGVYFACGISPEMIEQNPNEFHKQSVGYDLAQQGYALFEGKHRFNPEAKYILAVPEEKVRVRFLSNIKEVEPAALTH